MELKNLACYRLGTMLYLYIKRGKEAMKTAKFQQHIGGNTSFMKILIMDTKGCGKLTSNDTYFDDSWFSGAKIAVELMFEKVDYCVLVKTSHKGFFLATLENLTKD